MTDKEIEACLRSAIDERTPDILDDLISELGIGTSPVIEFDTSTKVPERRNRIRMLALAAAAVVVLAMTFGIRQMIGRTVAVVGLDVNPSVELSVNRNNKVISAEALNAEGRELIADLNLKGTDVNTACSAIVGSMLTKGYLTDSTNSVLVSVRSGDAEKGRELELFVAEDLNKYLQDAPVSAAVLGQFVEDNKDLADFADGHDVSRGKAWLIRRLLSAGSRHITEESLLKLTTQELILLAQEKGLFTEASYGEADTGKYIDRNKAVETALEAAGIAEKNAAGIEVEFDCEDGAIIYEVEFTANGIEYEYDIDAVTGTVIGFEQETVEEADRIKGDGDDSEDDDSDIDSDEDDDEEGNQDEDDDSDDDSDGDDEDDDRVYGEDDDEDDD